MIIRFFWEPGKIILTINIQLLFHLYRYFSERDIKTDKKPEAEEWKGLIIKSVKRL